MNTQLHLAADTQPRVLEQIKRVADNALGGIFHRHDAVIRRPGLDLAKHIPDAVQCQGLHRMAELFQRGRLGEGAFRPQVGDGERFFQRQAGRHDFAEQAHHFRVRQGTGIAFPDPAQDDGLALGAVELRVLAGGKLDRRHFPGTACPLADQVLDLLIQAVDAPAQVVELAVFTHVQLATAPGH